MKGKNKHKYVLEKNKPKMARFLKFTLHSNLNRQSLANIELAIISRFGSNKKGGQAKLTNELTNAMQIFSNRSVSFLGLQKVTKFLAVRYISMAVGRSLPPSIALSTFFRTSFSIRILVSQPRIAD